LWNDWNLDHATKHGCRIEEIESVVRRELVSRRQRKCGSQKWIVAGRGIGDRVLEVVFVVDPEETIYVIHAMPLSTRRRRRSR